MGLKYQIAKLEDVPENVRSLYVLQGDKYVLDAEGVVPKERLDEFRNNNISLTQQLDRFKNVDPTKYAELMEIQRKIDEKKLMDAGQFDDVVNMRVQAMKGEYDTKVTSLETDLGVAKQSLSALMIDNVIKTVAIKLGVAPEAIDDVVLRAKTIYSIDNGKAVPKDAEGKVIYGKDGSSPMPVEEWVTGLKTSARHLFLGSNGSGAGGGRGSRGKPDLGAMTPAQKIAFGIANGSTAKPSSLPLDQNVVQN